MNLHIETLMRIRKLFPDIGAVEQLELTRAVLGLRTVGPRQPEVKPRQPVGGKFLKGIGVTPVWAMMNRPHNIVTGFRMMNESEQ